MEKLAVVQDKFDQTGPARPGGAAVADHRGDHLAQGKSSRRARRSLSPRPRNSCSASTSSIARTSTTALDVARDLGEANPGGAYEIRPVGLLYPGSNRDMSDTAWIDAALTSARPQAVGALLRYFRNLDTAEEAFQNACLRALKSWPQNGPPRDPASWLIMVGRNVAIDDIRRGRKQQPLPEDDQAISDLISDLGDAEDATGRTARWLALSRRYLAAAVHLLPRRPAADPADRAGAAHRLGAHREADRARVPGRRRRDGAAHHPRQGPCCRCRRAVRDAGGGGAQRTDDRRSAR